MLNTLFNSMETINKINNSDVFKEDINEFRKQISHLDKNGDMINVFCSFAYLTPNYTVLFTLEELRRRTKSGNYKIFIVFWDMNTLANPYFKKEISNRKVKSPENYIENKIKELRCLAISIGFKEEEIIIYKSSDLWRRLISFREENLFQNFYSILSEINLDYFIETKKVSNTFQIPLDIFFCNYLHLLYPEDIQRPIDLAFLGNHKLKIYDTIRKRMEKEGLIKMKKPLFLIMKDFPYLNFKSYVPEWSMSLKEITGIINDCEINKVGFISLIRNIALSIELEIDKKTFEYSEFISRCEELKEEELKEILSKNLYNYLKKSKEMYLLISKEISEEIKNLSNENEIKSIGNVLRSDIAMKILLLSDGTKNTTNISKILKKSVPTISTYTNKLKKLGLVRVLEDRKLKRNIRGIKINFELGINKTP